MEKDWVLVYSSRQMHKIQLLKHLLSSYDIESIVLNQQDSIYVTIGDINLLVLNTDVIHANKIISEAQL
ncbi:DUF2007 domain-containing protein [Cryomorpha ignava]|nr:DUF2007 domain-containing protein [Cryomorpha ignava]